jgi:hypothetical protein
MTNRKTVRLVTTAWGDSYVSTALEIMIPALLAPGNLPALAQDFDLEFAIATESANFDRIRNSDAMRRLSRFAKPILRSIDDLVDHPAGYGQALTRALHRGFDDLGEAMVGANLMFLNADFIVADGSYRNLGRHILAGEQIVFAPSYCAISEAVERPLVDARNRNDGVLQMKPRDLAQLILDFRHMTIRAKTVNRRFMHMHVTDQFYWEVGANTLLGRQLPISLVYMRPERAYLEPICFWDYAVISMACPNAPRKVLGDSDEFLMLELRKGKTFEELMRIGRQEMPEIAKGLGYMTPDQFEMGRYDLTLHSGDLPATIGAERAKLAAFVDEIYRLLPPPSSAHRHKFWVDQVENARAARDVQKRSREDHLYRTELIEASNSRPVPSEALAESAVDGEGKSSIGELPAPSISRRIFNDIFGAVPRVTRLHPYWAELRHPTSAFDEVLSRIPEPSVLMVRTPGPQIVLEPLVTRSPGRYVLARPLPLMRYGIPQRAGNFDICIFELNWMEMNEFPRLLSFVRSRMNPGARAIAHHAGEQIYSMTNAATAGIAALLPAGLPSEVSFSGSQATLALQRSFRAAVERNADRPDRNIRNLRELVRLAPAAWIANAAQARLPTWRIGELCMSITIVTDLPGGSVKP